MKRLKTAFFITGWTTLFLFSAPAFGGSLTITSGPTFTPDSAFTNNTIAVQVFTNPPGVTGDLAKVTGSATVTPPSGNSAMVEIAGNYSANAGDIASVAYSFIADWNLTVPVNYTLSGTATIFGSPETFSSTGTIQPGLRQYVGTAQAPISFPVPASGTFSAALSLDFGPAARGTGLTGATGTLNLRIEQLGFQMATTPAVNAPPSQSLNISTRLAVETADNVLIAGIINPGPDSKRVLVRGIGPSLSDFFSGVLADPIVRLFSGEAELASNDNWRSTQEADIIATGIPPAEDLESALIHVLEPGSYTAILSGVNNGTGIALVEVYDIDHAADSRLANISTRGLVGTGNNVMIGGFILGPDANGASSVIVRGIGPSLGALGVPNALQDPLLELRDGNGELIASNDNWMDHANQQTISNNGLAPTDNNESALLAIPAPGSYTAILSGASNGSGVGLVEVYHFLNLP